MRLHRPYCCYCKRTLAPMHPEIGLSLTFDHIVPKADGGRRRVPCCRTCNGLKADLPIADWRWFISCASHARWWKLFTHSSQIASVCQAERSRRAFAGEAQIGRDGR